MDGEEKSIQQYSSSQPLLDGTVPLTSLSEPLTFNIEPIEPNDHQPSSQLHDDVDPNRITEQLVKVNQPIMETIPNVSVTTRYVDDGKNDEKESTVSDDRIETAHEQNDVTTIESAPITETVSIVSLANPNIDENERNQQPSEPDETVTMTPTSIDSKSLDQHESRLDEHCDSSKVDCSDIQNSIDDSVTTKSIETIVQQPNTVITSVRTITSANCEQMKHSQNSLIDSNMISDKGGGISDPNDTIRSISMDSIICNSVISHINQMDRLKINKNNGNSCNTNTTSSANSGISNSNSNSNSISNSSNCNTTSRISNNDCMESSSCNSLINKTNQICDNTMNRTTILCRKDCDNNVPARYIVEQQPRAHTNSDCTTYTYQSIATPKVQPLQNSMIGYEGIDIKKPDLGTSIPVTATTQSISGGGGFNTLNDKQNFDNTSRCFNNNNNNRNYIDKRVTDQGTSYPTVPKPSNSLYVSNPDFSKSMEHLSPVNCSKNLPAKDLSQLHINPPDFSKFTDGGKKTIVSHPSTADLRIANPDFSMKFSPSNASSFYQRLPPESKIYPSSAGKPLPQQVNQNNFDQIRKQYNYINDLQLKNPQQPVGSPVGKKTSLNSGLYVPLPDFTRQANESPAQKILQPIDDEPKAHIIHKNLYKPVELSRLGFPQISHDVTMSIVPSNDDKSKVPLQPKPTGNYYPEMNMNYNRLYNYQPLQVDSKINPSNAPPPPKNQLESIGRPNYIIRTEPIKSPINHPGTSVVPTTPQQRYDHHYYNQPTESIVQPTKPKTPIVTQPSPYQIQSNQMNPPPTTWTPPMHRVSQSPSSNTTSPSLRSNSQSPITDSLYYRPNQTPSPYGQQTVPKFQSSPVVQQSVPQPQRIQSNDNWQQYNQIHHPMNYHSMVPTSRNEGGYHQPHGTTTTKQENVVYPPYKRPVPVQQQYVPKPEPAVRKTESKPRPERSQYKHQHPKTIVDPTFYRHSSEADLNYEIVTKTLNRSSGSVPVQFRRSETDLSKNIFENLTSEQMNDRNYGPNQQYYQDKRNDIRAISDLNRHDVSVTVTNRTEQQPVPTPSVLRMKNYHPPIDQTIDSNSKIQKNVTVTATATSLPADKRESPLDLSVKTVKTKADSTGDDYSSHQSIGRSSLKIDFAPNFQRHTVQSSVTDHRLNEQPSGMRTMPTSKPKPYQVIRNAEVGREQVIAHPNHFNKNRSGGQPVLKPIETQSQIRQAISLNPPIPTVFGRKPEELKNLPPANTDYYRNRDVVKVKQEPINYPKPGYPQTVPNQGYPPQRVESQSAQSPYPPHSSIPYHPKNFHQMDRHQPTVDRYDYGSQDSQKLPDRNQVRIDETRKRPMEMKEELYAPPNKRYKEEIQTELNHSYQPIASSVLPNYPYDNRAVQVPPKIAQPRHDIVPDQQQKRIDDKPQSQMYYPNPTAYSPYDQWHQQQSRYHQSYQPNQNVVIQQGERNSHISYTGSQQQQQQQQQHQQLQQQHQVQAQQQHVHPQQQQVQPQQQQQQPYPVVQQSYPSNTQDSRWYSGESQSPVPYTFMQHLNRNQKSNEHKQQERGPPVQVPTEPDLVKPTIRPEEPPKYTVPPPESVIKNIKPQQYVTPHPIRPHYSSMGNINIPQHDTPPVSVPVKQPVHKGADQSVISKLRINLEMKELEKQKLLRSQSQTDIVQMASSTEPRIRTKGELKGYTPITPSPIVQSEPVNQIPRKQQSEPEKSIETRHRLEINKVPSDDSKLSLNLLDWGTACNDFVVQLQTAPVKYRARRKRKPKEPKPDPIFPEPPNEIEDIKIPKSEPELKVEPAEPIIVPTNLSTDEDAPLVLLKRQVSKKDTDGTATVHPNENLDLETINQRPPVKIDPTNVLEKVKENQENRRNTNSSSDSEQDRTKEKRSKKIIRKPRTRASIVLKYSSDEDEQSTDERSKSKFCKRKRINGWSSDSDSIKGDREKMKVKKYKPAKIIDSDETDMERDLKVVEKLKPNKKIVLEETMTRSKRKKELEQQIANSKVLRNEKIIKNTVVPVIDKKLDSKLQKTTVKQKCTIDSVKRRVLGSDSEDGKSIGKKPIPNTTRLIKFPTSTSGTTDSDSPSDSEIVGRLRTKRLKLKKDKQSKEIDKKTEELIPKNQSDEKYPPGWQEDLYEFKKALKVPETLISVKRPHGKSSSLPDLDPHSSDASETSARLINLMSAGTKQPVRSKLATDDKKLNGIIESASIIDVLHQRISRPVTGRGRKIRPPVTPESKITPQTNEAELLPTPGTQVPTEVFTERKSIFHTDILTSRTRNKQRAIKNKENIRAVFGSATDDRPSSAPPITMTFEQKYEEYIRMSTIDFPNRYGHKVAEPIQIEDLKIKVEKMDDIDDENSRYTELTEMETKSMDIKEEILSDRNDTPNLLSERDGATPSSFTGILKSGRKMKGTRHTRRKGSSGFDYIRKKKKIVIPQNNPDGTPPAPPKRRTAAINYLQQKDENDINREIRGWVLNKGVGESVLHKASRCGYMDVVAYCLVRLEMHPDQKDNAGYTPLHEACSKGWVEIARILLQYGANHSETAHSGIRPLHKAAQNGYIEIVRLLLSYGADPLLCTYSGQTPLMLAEEDEMIALLKNHLIDVQNTGPNKQPWKFDGAWNIYDSEEIGYNIFDDLPMIECKETSRKEKSEPKIVVKEPLETCDSNSNIMLSPVGTMRVQKLPVEIPVEKSPEVPMTKLLETPPRNSNIIDTIKLNKITTNCTVVLNNIGAMYSSIRDHNDTVKATKSPDKPICSINSSRMFDKPKQSEESCSDSDLEQFEFEECQRTFLPLYRLKDEGTEKWVLMTDVFFALNIKSKETLLKQMGYSTPPSTPTMTTVSTVAANRDLFREMKFSEFLERATCLQLLSSGEKLNVMSTKKVTLVKYTDSIQELLGVTTITMKL